jgi:hypothetical protein
VYKCCGVGNWLSAFPWMSKSMLDWHEKKIESEYLEIRENLFIIFRFVDNIPKSSNLLVDISIIVARLEECIWVGIHGEGRTRSKGAEILTRSRDSKHRFD